MSIYHAENILMLWILKIKYCEYMVSAIEMAELWLNDIKRYRNHISNKEFLVLATCVYNINNLILQK